jgi:hypothetical protein
MKRAYVLYTRRRTKVEAIGPADEGLELRSIPVYLSKDCNEGVTKGSELFQRTSGAGMIVMGSRPVLNVVRQELLVETRAAVRHRRSRAFLVCYRNSRWIAQSWSETGIGLSEVNLVSRMTDALKKNG